MPKGGISLVGLTDRDSQRLDSSEVLRGGNCRSTVREVTLFDPDVATYNTLEEAIAEANSEGYKPYGLRIVNVVHTGGFGNNEPRSVLVLRRRHSTQRPDPNRWQAIIAEKLTDRGSHMGYGFYIHLKGFRYARDM